MFKIATASVGAVSLAGAATALEKPQVFDPLSSSVISANHLVLDKPHKAYDQIIDALASDAKVAQAQSANPDKPKKIKTINDDFSDIASIDPDFGGMFYDSESNINIYMLNSQKDNAPVINAIAKTFGADKISKRQIKIKQANYRFSDLKAWHDEAISLFEIPGVITSSIDHTTNSLKIEVDDLEKEAAIRSQLDILGIPNGAAHVEKGELILEETASLRQKIRPVEGGLSIATNTVLCTLGFNAELNGVEGFVTASHCSTARSVADGTIFFQITNSADRIGEETEDPPFTTGGTCPVNFQCRESDVNFSAFDQGVNKARGFIEKTQGLNTPQNLHNTDIVGSFQITGTGDVIVGDKVDKVGRSSGWTGWTGQDLDAHGLVTEVCADVAVSGTSIIMLCQNEASYQSAPGDSGAGVFVPNSNGVNTVTLVGSHWGGIGSVGPCPAGCTDEGYSLTTTGVFNPYRAITSELGPLTVTAPIPTETPTATATATATATPAETPTLQPSILGGVDQNPIFTDSEQIKQSEKNKNKKVPLVAGLITALAGTAFFAKKNA